MAKDDIGKLTINDTRCISQDVSMIGNRGSDSNFHFIPFLCKCLGGKHLRYGFKSHTVKFFDFHSQSLFVGSPKLRISRAAV